MFNFIRNFFQHKAKSIEDFIEVMKRERCNTAVVEPNKTSKDGAKTKAVGLITDFQYILEFTAITPRGRKVVYRQNLFKRFGSDFGYADAEDRRNATIKLFLLGEQKVKELQAKLPTVSVDLIGPNDRPMNDEMYAKLHQDAATCSVSV